jgi:hypothetical protein
VKELAATGVILYIETTWRKETQYEEETQRDDETRLYRTHPVERRLLYGRRVSPGNVRTTKTNKYRTRLYHSISSTYQLDPRSGGPFIKRPGETTTRRAVWMIYAEGSSIERPGEMTARRPVRTIDAEGRLIERLGETRKPFKQSMRSYEWGMIDNRVFDNSNKTFEEIRLNHSYPNDTLLVKAINQDQRQVWRPTIGIRTVWIMIFESRS